MSRYQSTRFLSRSTRPVLAERCGCEIRGTVNEAFYEHIPEFTAAALIRLYNNFYCTLVRLEAYGSLKDVNTYVKWQDGLIRTLILFRMRRGTVMVLNQQIALEKQDIETFCASVFNRYKRAHAVRFYALDLTLDKLCYPFRQFSSLEENVVPLRLGKEAYLGKVKGQFKKQLRVAEEQIRAAYPDFSIALLAQQDIAIDTVKAIMALAQKRMRAKGRDDYTRSIDLTAMAPLLRVCGYVVVARIGERICGGAVWFATGNRHFHQLAAHDPEFDTYMLGNQLWFAAILRSLELGAEECWLMGGYSAHKARFGARTKSLNSITLYRSRPHMLLDCGGFVGTYSRQHMHALKNAVNQNARAKKLTEGTARLALAAAKFVQCFFTSV